MPCPPENLSRILRYLLHSYQINAEAEVSGHELQHELDLSPEQVRECVETLTSTGLAAAEFFPVNIWLRLTDEGLRRAEFET